MSELESNLSICFSCEMKKSPPEKVLDDTFIKERLNEFYPESEFLGYCYICEACHQELLHYYLNK